MKSYVPYSGAVKRAYEFFSKLNRDEATLASRLIVRSGFKRMLRATKGATRYRLSGLYYRLKQFDLLDAADAVLHVYWKLKREWLQRDDQERSDQLFQFPTEGAATPIDKEIEALENPVRWGKDCPPCWRCKWYEGYLPAKRKILKMQLVDPEVRQAIAATENRKIEIAKLVRLGTVFP